MKCQKGKKSKFLCDDHLTSCLISLCGMQMASVPNSDYGQHVRDSSTCSKCCGRLFHCEQFHMPPTGYHWGRLDNLLQEWTKRISPVFLCNESKQVLFSVVSCQELTGLFTSLGPSGD